MTKALVEIGGVARDSSELTLPADREFRDAWVLTGDVVEVDQTKADAIRAERAAIKAARDELAKPAPATVPGLAQRVAAIEKLLGLK